MINQLLFTNHLSIEDENYSCAFFLSFALIHRK